MRQVTVRVACVQLAARPLHEARQALDDILGGVAAAASQGAQLVVLPECAYPGYVLLTRSPFRGIPDPDDALRAIASAARGAGSAVVCGIARFDDRGRLRNEAVYFDRRGDEIARYAKMFLWNFDGAWFTAGREIPVFDTEFGRLGMMICADGRMPEIPRTLARRGAWLVLDPTAWVSFGSSYESMRNPQVDYMMSVRARENGIWIAAADKCGTENSSVHYVGHSMIVAPDGHVVASGAAEPLLVVADAVRSKVRPFVIALTAIERQALLRLKPPKGRSDRGSLRLGVLQGPLRAGRSTAVRTLTAQGARAIIDTAASPGAMRAAMRAQREARAVVVTGNRMLAPEPARAAALLGADIIVWASPPRHVFARDVARTRAVENRVYVAVCAATTHPAPACVIDPGGSIVAQALAGEPSGFVAVINVAAARDKIVVPGTDVFASRVPRAFAGSGRLAPR